MSVKKLDKIYYRAAATPITTIAFSGSTPAGWTALPAAAKVSSAKINHDKKETTELNDGTTYVGSEAGDIEVSFIDFAAGDFATIRTALMNVLVDILMIDSNNKAPAYCLWGVRTYPRLNMEKEPTITIVGAKERSSGASPSVSIIPVT